MDGYALTYMLDSFRLVYVCSIPDLKAHGVTPDVTPLFFSQACRNIGVYEGSWCRLCKNGRGVRTGRGISGREYPLWVSPIGEEVVSWRFSLCIEILDLV